MSVRKAYPSDVSDEEWAFVAPYLCLMRLDAPQRHHDLREVFNALRWIIRAGAPWRLLPHEFPAWEVVYQQTQRWIRAGVFDEIVHDLGELLRLAEGRSAAPSAVIFDSRTLQSTPESGQRAGWDGAKRKKGSKVHLAVDTLGHLLALHVSPANDQDRAQVGAPCAAVQEASGQRVEVAYVRLRGSQFFRNPEAAMEPVLERIADLGIERNSDEQESKALPDDSLAAEIRRMAAEIRRSWQGDRGDTRRQAYDEGDFETPSAPDKGDDEPGEPPLRPDASPARPAMEEPAEPAPPFELRSEARQLSFGDSRTAAPSAHVTAESPTPKPVEPRASAPVPTSHEPVAQPSEVSGGPVALATFQAWDTSTRMGDPRTLPRDVLLQYVIAIVRVEGPVSTSVVLERIGRASGRRMTKLAASPVNKAVAAAIGKKMILDENPLARLGQRGKVLRLPDTPPVVIRERGPRDLIDIPPNEVAALIRQLIGSDPDLSGEELKRTVLATYDLVRLTQQAAAYLDASAYCLLPRRRSGHPRSAPETTLLFPSEFKHRRNWRGGSGGISRPSSAPAAPVTIETTRADGGAQQTARAVSTRSPEGSPSENDGPDVGGMHADAARPDAGEPLSGAVPGALVPHSDGASSHPAVTPWNGTLLPYSRWRPRRTVMDPRPALTGENAQHLSDVVRDEGPVVVGLAYQRIADAAGVRLEPAVRALLSLALSAAISRGLVVSSDPLEYGVEATRVLRLPNAARVVVRERGERELTQIPADEIAMLASRIRESQPDLGLEELRDQLLAVYGIDGVPTTVRQFLNDCIALAASS